MMTDCTLRARFLRDEAELELVIDTDSWVDTEFEPDAELQTLLEQFRAANSGDDESTIMEAFPRYVYDRAMIAYAAEQARQERFDGLMVPCVICGNVQCFQHQAEQSALEIEPTPPTGFYGDGEPIHVFTPNVDNFLSQDVEFVMWEDHNGSHAVLRKADAYNGYGDSLAYRVLGDDGTEPLDYASAFIACDGGTDPNPGQLTLDGTAWARCQAVWDYIPGHNGVDQGHGFGNLPGWRDKGDYEAEEGTEPRKGVLVIDDDEEVAFCPVCGSGKLIGSKF